MYLEKQSVTGTINELLAQASTELFADYGVSLERGHYSWGTSDEPLLSSVMGFVGTHLRGTCLLACENAPLAASCPKGGRARDWIGELANQLVGRLKVKLLSYSENVALTTPIVLQGIRLQPLPKAAIEPTLFTGSGGTVLVWIEVEVEGNFSLPAPQIPEAGSPGDFMLF
jgi:hypothetical protein